ncbi:MAG: MlaD family protein [Thermodesulfobacteriota bacterium]
MINRLIIVVIMAMVLTGFSFGTAAIHVRFDDINGLVARDRVVFDGTGIGKVKKITYGDDGLFLVSLSIDKEFKAFLTEYSRFTITEDPRDNDRKAVEMLLTHMGGEPLKNGSSVEGSSKYEVLLEMMKDDARDGVEFLKKEYQRFSKDLKSLSEHEKVKELMEQMARLEKELKKASQETRDKITSEIIPMLEEEIKELRKELEALGREEEVEPLEKKLEKIKYI